MAKNEILARLIKVIKFKSNLTQSEIAARIGVSKQYLSDTINGRYPFNEELKQKLHEQFTYLSEEHRTEQVIERPTGIPYFKEIPVSAGKAELMDVENEENAVGFINITGVSGKMAFPVIGCSMEPVIHAGDVVVVDELNQWDKIDPDKVYLIFTHDDRMIKHLETDEEDKEILWCVSPNYKRFSVSKSEILKIYKVTFYGRLV